MHPGTASRALDPALPGRVTARTKEKVERAARELGYTPDPVARSLRTRRSGAVGVVVPDLTNPVIPPIIRGIEEVRWSAGRASRRRGRRAPRRSMSRARHTRRTAARG